MEYVISVQYYRLEHILVYILYMYIHVHVDRTRRILLQHLQICTRLARGSAVPLPPSGSHLPLLQVEVGAHVTLG